jgi:Novel toxin 16
MVSPTADVGPWIRRGRAIVALLGEGAPVSTESEGWEWEKDPRKRKAARREKRRGWERSKYAGTGTADSTCTPARHLDLQRAVKAVCSDYACDDAMIGCREIADRGRRAVACATARANINQECYRGGDQGHRDAHLEATRAAAKCRRIYRTPRPGLHPDAPPRCAQPLDFFDDFGFELP